MIFLNMEVLKNVKKTVKLELKVKIILLKMEMFYSSESILNQIRFMLKYTKTERRIK